MLASDSLDGEDVNEISLPYTIDPSKQHVSLMSYLQEESQQRSSTSDSSRDSTQNGNCGNFSRLAIAERDKRILRGFTMHRHERQLKQIFTTCNTFDEETLESSENDLLSKGLVVENEVIKNPMFNCRWDHLHGSASDSIRNSNRSNKFPAAFGMTLKPAFKDEEEVTECLLDLDDVDGGNGQSNHGDSSGCADNGDADSLEKDHREREGETREVLDNSMTEWGDFHSGA
jgi:hypothetical protein